MKVLVTGGCGYLGRPAVRALQAAGHEVSVFDSRPYSNGQDLRSASEIQKALVAFGQTDVVLHLAGWSSIRDSFSCPHAYWFTNVYGTSVLCREMLEAGCKRLVLASSCAVYQQHRENLSEDWIIKPTTPYGMTKQAAEMVAESFKHQGLSTITLRFFNIAGASDNIVDESNAARIIPQAITSTPEKPMLLRSSLELTRDFVHVLDAADACVRACESVTLGGNDVFNVGRGEPVTLREAIACVAGVIGRNVSYENREPIPGEQHRLVANNWMAEGKLGWKPTRDLRQMVQDAWDNINGKLGVTTEKEVK